MMLKIILTATDEPLYQAWQKYCSGFDFVTFHKGSITDIPTDAVVSPANSYGFMDGGIDRFYSNYFGYQIEQTLRNAIAEKHHGELLVGTAEIVETNHDHIPFLIAAPTMRVPMRLKDSINPYLAARGVFLLLKTATFSNGRLKGQKAQDLIKTISFPGLGTGIGGIPAEICAKQVKTAIQEFLLEEYKIPQDWAEASERHQLLYGARVKNLQY